MNFQYTIYDSVRTNLGELLERMQIAQLCKEWKSIPRPVQQTKSITEDYMLALFAKFYMGCVLIDIRKSDLSSATGLKANQPVNKAQVEQVKT